MSETESNKAVVRRVYEHGYNAGDESVFAELFGPGFEHHSKVLHDMPPGGEGERQSMLRFRASMPDVRFEILQLVAEDDHVAARLHITGTPSGDFAAAVSATDDRFDVHALALFRLEGGQLAEEWFYVDGGTPAS